MLILYFACCQSCKLRNGHEILECDVCYMKVLACVLLFFNSSSYTTVYATRVYEIDWWTGSSLTSCSACFMTWPTRNTHLLQMGWDYPCVLLALEQEVSEIYERRCLHVIVSAVNWFINCRPSLLEADPLMFSKEDPLMFCKSSRNRQPNTNQATRMDG